VSPAAWLVLSVVGATPLAVVGWFRWRFRADKMSANADKLLADAEARMRALEDKALIAQFDEPIGDEGGRDCGHREDADRERERPRDLA